MLKKQIRFSVVSTMIGADTKEPAAIVSQLKKTQQLKLS